jgi:hypothetical protein
VAHCRSDKYGPQRFQFFFRAASSSNRRASAVVSRRTNAVVLVSVSAGEEAACPPLDFLLMLRARVLRVRRRSKS